MHAHKANTDKRVFWIGGPSGRDMQSLTDKLKEYGLHIQGQTNRISKRVEIPTWPDLVIVNKERVSHAQSDKAKKECLRIGKPMVLGTHRLVSLLPLLANLELIDLMDKTVEEGKTAKVLPIKPPSYDSWTAYRDEAGNVRIRRPGVAGRDAAPVSWRGETYSTSSALAQAAGTTATRLRDNVRHQSLLAGHRVTRATMAEVKAAFPGIVVEDKPKARSGFVSLPKAKMDPASIIEEYGLSYGMGRVVEGLITARGVEDLRRAQERLVAEIDKKETAR